MTDSEVAYLASLDPTATVVSDVPTLTSYPLPPDVIEVLLAVAGEADILILGEMHGTKEVPCLVNGLLPALVPLGYKALAYELYADEQPIVANWRRGGNAPVPEFFAKPSFDGRGNVQVLGLLTDAAQVGWHILCFDRGAGQSEGAEWRDRDRYMARNLLEQRRRFCADTKVIAVCGNMHSRLVPALPGDWREAFWPSFAGALQSENPALIVRSINIVFHSGTFYNCGVRGGGSGNVPSAPYVTPGQNDEHTLDLHLPRSTAASFLQTPAKVPVPEPSHEKE